MSMDTFGSCLRQIMQTLHRLFSSLDNSATLTSPQGGRETIWKMRTDDDRRSIQSSAV